MDGSPEVHPPALICVENNPCPATNRTSGSCPDDVIDDIIPLKCGGSDSAAAPVTSFKSSWDGFTSSCPCSESGQAESLFELTEHPGIPRSARIERFSSR